MASETLSSLKRLDRSDELLELEAAILRKRTDILFDLRALEGGAELSKLSEKLAVTTAPSVLELVEEFGRLDINDEHLHSRFLEFFLRPDEKRHGLSDAFLKALLNLGDFFRNGVRTSKVDLGADFLDTKITREAKSEQGRADFKLRNSRQRVVLLIENKTLSPEGDRQLAKYWEDAERADPGFAIGGLFLTPNGRQPTTAGKYNYSAVSYGEVAELLARCVEFREAYDPGVILVKQYASAIKRWFVEDPEKKRLAWRIYRKYPAAAAYLSTDGVKPMRQISEHLRGLISKQGSGVEAVYTYPGAEEVGLWFVPRDWDKVSRLRRAGTRAKEKRADDRLTVFWVSCNPGSEHEYERQLGLYLGTVPGARADDVGKLIRAIAREALSSSQELMVDDGPGETWRTIWARTLLTDEQLNQEDRDLVFQLIDERWQRFLNSDLPKLESVIGTLFEQPSTRTSG